MSKIVNGKSNWHTIIIGAGQAGLAAGYFLSGQKDNFIIIDSAENIGDSWRKRWDSLHLFTPAQYDGLPGFPFPLPKGSFPSKDDMAEYLVNYSTKFNLPVRTGIRVISLSQCQSGFEILTTPGNTYM